MLDGYLWIAQSPFVWAAIGFGLVLFILNNVAIPVERARAGSARFEAWFRAHVWETLVAVILAPFLLLAVSELIALWETKPDPRNPSVTPGDLRWHVSLIVAMLGAIGGIFTIFFATIRAAATERQTRTAEAQHDHADLVLVNQRIQSALEQLSARTRETRIGRTVIHNIDGGTDSVLQWQDEGPHDLSALVKPQAQPWTAFERDVPDVQTRLSGIGQLDAIRKETDGRGRAINEHLANFIRANAPATVAQRHPAQEAPEEETADDRRELIAALRGWARSLAPPADIQAAFALIGRSTGESTTSGLDLRRIAAQGVELPNAHLQKCLLSAAHLEGAAFLGAYLEGADLGGAHLEGADLGGANLEGAYLGRAHLAGADLTGAHLEGARLRSAHLEGAILRGAHLERANLWEAHLEVPSLRGARLEGTNVERAHLEGADLMEAHLERTNLRSTHLERASLEGAHLEGSDLREAHLQGANLSGAHLQGANLSGAHLEGVILGGANLQGAILRGAHLQGADLRGAHLDDRTDFRAATLRGAALMSVDLSKATTNEAFHEAFGGGSVILPEGYEAGKPPLEHWAPERLNHKEFRDRWRSWQAEIGYTPPG